MNNQKFLEKEITRKGKMISFLENFNNLTYVIDSLKADIILAQSQLLDNKLKKQ